ncbi:hypothetical protein JDV02_007444 [Purpureocillium takamizusanense]|uniref:N-acetylglucosamine-induced protein 1 n=1 Tax=Purpureocillium takamizusanense TaxID=2060973 RepID=A0A9Q8VCB5_9HYPO|nr:uncharacterized protein JDV02_007444 [Purpureocillium takamizusanense]UNI21455.1 hypothetical protein JDV02_007444 [Purpureocillium takamizusanense]
MKTSIRCLRVGACTTTPPAARRGTISASGGSSSALRLGPRVPAPYLILTPSRALEPYAPTTYVVPPSAARAAVSRRETHHLCSRVDDRVGGKTDSDSFGYSKTSPGTCCFVRARAVGHRCCLAAPFTSAASRTMGDDVDRGPDAPEESPFPLTAVDKWILSQTDEEFKLHDWEDLKQIIESNNLSILKRKPSDLRRYMKWTAETKAAYGSMTNYILTHRLPKSWGQPPFTPSSTVPFEDPADFKVLLNDWPYGLDPNITHIVVWSRTLIPTDDDTGDMTPESRKLVGDFVKRYFVNTLGPGGDKQVLWFKNWVALQSVRSLEHIHVLVRDVDDDTLERWSGERPKRGSA